MNSTMEKLTDRILEKAITYLDENDLAMRLADKLKEELSESINFEDFDVSEWIMEIIQNERCPAGKAFKTAMENLALKMAEAIDKK